MYKQYYKYLQPYETVEDQTIEDPSPNNCRARYYCGDYRFHLCFKFVQ